MPKFAHSPIHLPSPVYGGGVTVGDGGGSGVFGILQSQVLAFSNVCQIGSTVAFKSSKQSTLPTRKT